MRQLLDCDPDVWDIYAVSGYGEHFPAFWDAMLDTPGRIALAVWDKASSALGGTSSMFQIDPANRSLEIGYTWLAPEHRGTCVNPETKLLMLHHAFAAGALRVQFTVDTRNTRSRAAMSKFAILEGTIRRRRVTWTGHKRDSAMFSVINSEWAEVAQPLKRQLGRGRRARRGISPIRMHTSAQTARGQRH
jgi:RimJ/RimL family protein N-acetyltransferase